MRGTAMNLMHLRRQLPRVRHRYSSGTRRIDGQTYQQRGNRWYV